MRPLESFWYRVAPFHLVLWPLSLVFSALSALRRTLYRAGWLQSHRLPVPVIVVGNITVGGTGKTPLVLWLASQARAAGHRPGILCRGYGGSATGPQAVLADSDPGVTGDEPVLLARRSECPVWIGADRVAAARALLAGHPDCDLLISDDGLQHYALQRDVELSVVDGARGFGNGMLLPAGPLRERVCRLRYVDAVVVNGDPLFERAATAPDVPEFSMRVRGDVIYAVSDPAAVVEAARFAGQTVHAVAAIGDPQRFFESLRALGIKFTPHPFPDHYAYTEDDLAFARGAAVIVTEKDAVKCERFRNDNVWALRVHAEVDPALATLVNERLRRASAGVAAHQEVRHGP